MEKEKERQLDDLSVFVAICKGMELLATCLLAGVSWKAFPVFQFRMAGKAPAM